MDHQLQTLESMPDRFPHLLKSVKLMGDPFVAAVDAETVCLAVGAKRGQLVIQGGWLVPVAPVLCPALIVNWCSRQGPGRGRLKR